MGATAEPATQQQVQTAVAEREHAEDALRPDVGQRGDTAASQVNAPRDIDFNGDQASTPASGASGVADVGQAAQPAASGGDWESVLDFARQNGYDTTGHADDRSFLQSLLANSRQRQQEDFYSQLGRQLAPHQDAIRAAIDARKKPAAPEGPQPWEAPQFDKRWLGLVEYDPSSGVFVGKPGAPANIVDAVNQYQKWNEQYGSNPLAAVKPWAEKTIPDIVQQQVAAQLSNYRKEQAVSQLIQSNSEWMYQRDQFGNPTVGQNGRYVPTPNGLRYGQYVNELERAGMTDPYVVDRYAKAQLMSDLQAEQTRANGQAAPQGQQANALAASRQQANVRQSRGPALLGNEPAPDQAGLSLTDSIRNNLSAAGYGSDADFKFDDF